MATSAGFNIHNHDDKVVVELVITGIKDSIDVTLTIDETEIMINLLKEKVKLAKKAK